MSITKNRALTLVAAFAMAAAGCQGEQGAAGAAGTQGPAGPAGTQGPKGDPGTSSIVTGTLEGNATFLLNGNGASTPASAVTVETLPPQVAADGVTPVTVPTDAHGHFQFANVPVGVYAVRFSGNGYTAATVDAVSVVAGKTAIANKVLVAANPLTVVSKVANQAVGFGVPVTLTVAVSGGKGPYEVVWAPKAANPTAAAATGSTVTADSNDATKATVTASMQTGTFDSILNGGKVVGLAASVYAPNADPKLVIDRAGFVPVTMQQVAQMTYNVDATITDKGTGWVKTVTVAVPTAPISQASVAVPTSKFANGSVTVPANTLMIAHIPTADGTTAATFTAPSGVALQDAASKWPWFIASSPGDYQVGALPTLTAAKYVSSDFTAGSQNPANCITCHDTGAVDVAGAKLHDWTKSAHGNHFFKFMEFDSGGNLAWKAGVTQLPTANPLMFWKTSDMRVDVNGHPLPMTTWEFGMTGAEGAHYSSSCMGCHMTGYNAAIDSGGADDVMKTNSWSFNPATAFAGKLFTASATDTGEPVTKKPDYTQLDAPASAPVKAFAGMQCESCHGPLGQHASTTRAAGDKGPAPKAEFDAAACAVCHDRPTNHDRVALWRQSGHANLEVAVNEAGTDTHGGVASCARCHAAQGFVEYLSQKAGVCTDFKDVAGAAITDAAKLPPLEGPLFIRDTSTVGKVICQVVDTNVAASKTASDTYLAARGLTSATIQPISCAACHDAHSTEIRVSGNTGPLPSGYQVNGAGSGALCMSCHNTRNGARGDTWGGDTVATKTPPLQNGVAVKAVGGPHEANQTDVLVGANAYWVSGYRGSRHLAVAETCVGCHMKLKPDSIAATNTNHTFKADTTICKHCHGEEVNGEAIEAQFKAASDATLARIAEVAKAPLASKFAIKGFNKTAGLAQTVVVDPTNIKSIDFVTGRAPGFKFTFVNKIKNPNDNTAADVDTLTVGLGQSDGKATALFAVDGSDAPTTALFDPLYGRIAKANWNWSLVQDGSKGFHNPTFAFEVFSVTKANVADVAKGAL